MRLKVLILILLLHTCPLFAGFVQLPGDSGSCFVDGLTGAIVCCSLGTCYWDCYYEPNLDAMVCTDCTYDSVEHQVVCGDSCFDLDTGLPCSPSDSDGSGGDGGYFPSPGDGGGSDDSSGGSGSDDDSSDCNICAYLYSILRAAQAAATILDNIRSDLALYHSRAINIFTNRIDTLQSRLESAIFSISSVLTSQTNPRLDRIYNEIQAVREVLNGIRNLIFDIHSYIKDDSVFDYLDDVVKGHLEYYASVGDLIREYSPSLTGLVFASLDSIYINLSQQSQRVNNESALIILYPVGFTPYFLYTGDRLYESGLLSSVVSHINYAAQTHLLPLASFSYFTIYLNLDHPTAYLVRFVFRLAVGLYMLYFFVTQRFKEYTSFFSSGGDD